MISGSLLDKADRALLAAKRAIDQQDTETAADRAYYAVYYNEEEDFIETARGLTQRL